MNAQNAYKILMTKLPDVVVQNCHEYRDRYVFYAIPSGLDENGKRDGVFDSLFSVDKRTGDILTFTPFDLTKTEMERGKRITIYDRK